MNINNRHPSLLFLLLLTLLASISSCLESNFLGPSTMVQSIKMYYVESGTLYKATYDKDFSQIAPAENMNLNNLIGVAIDQEAKKLYFSSNRFIMRSDLDGSNIETAVTHIATSAVKRIILFPNEDKVFYAVGTAIYRANLSDGSMVQSMNFTFGNGFGIDILNNKIYSVTDITCCDPDYITNVNIPDGTDAGMGPVVGLNNPASILVKGNKIYWLNAGDDLIKAANLDGSGSETIADASGLNIDKLYYNEILNKFFWTDSLNDDIRCVNFDGSDPKIILSLPANPRHLAIYVEEIEGFR